MKKSTVIMILVVLVLLVVGVIAVRRARNNDESYTPIQEQETVVIDTEIDNDTETVDSVEETIESIDSLLQGLEFDQDFEEVEDF